MSLNNIATGHILRYQLALTGISLDPYEVHKTGISLDPYEVHKSPASIAGPIFYSKLNRGAHP